MDSSKFASHGPIVEGFFTWPSDDPRLVAGRCKTCGKYFFPKNYPMHKIGCAEEDIEEILMSKTGVLRSYTWQYYPPPPPYRAPDPFKPFGIGFVEFEEGINIVGILAFDSIGDVEVGMKVQVTVGELHPFDDKNLTWQFGPVSK